MTAEISICFAFWSAGSLSNWSARDDLAISFLDIWSKPICRSMTAAYSTVTNTTRANGPHQLALRCRSEKVFVGAMKVFKIRAGSDIGGSEGGGVIAVAIVILAGFRGIVPLKTLGEQTQTAWSRRNEQFTRAAAARFFQSRRRSLAVDEHVWRLLREVALPLAGGSSCPPTSALACPNLPGTNLCVSF